MNATVLSETLRQMSESRMEGREAVHALQFLLTKLADSGIQPSLDRLVLTNEELHYFPDLGADRDIEPISADGV